MCVLRVSGATFDPDEFLKSAALGAARVFRAGESRSQGRPDGAKYEFFGFTVDVSDASWDDLQAQIVDAVRFLEARTSELTRLRSWPGVESIRLDFPLNSRISASNLAQFELFPAPFVEAAGRIGVGLEISIYASEGAA